MKSVMRIRSQWRCKPSEQEDEVTADLNTKVGLIQELIPIGLEAVSEELQREVARLAGVKHSCEGGLRGYSRWGS